MKHLTLIFAVLASLLASATLHALPITWEVNLAAQQPQVFTLQRPRGETYDLEAVLKYHGKPFEPAITNACIYWQTNGMENLYWSAPASVSTNTVPAASSPRGVAETNYCLRATWLPSMDPGSTTVRGYIGDPGHIYAAAFQFRFIASPGALPNELPLPQKVIDFANVTVLNPPWSGGGGGGGVDTNAVREIAREEIVPATNRLNQTLSDSISSKRGLTDLAVYEEGLTFSGPSELTDVVSRYNLRPEHGPIPEGAWLLGNPGMGQDNIVFPPVEAPADATTITFGAFYFDTWEYAGELVVTKVKTPTGAKLAHTSATSGLAKFGADGELTAATAQEDPFEETGDYVQPEALSYVANLASEANERSTYAIADSGRANESISIHKSATDAHAGLFELKADRTMISATDQTFSNAVATVAKTVTPTRIRTYDRIRQCWWVLEMVNGVPTWTVED